MADVGVPRTKQPCLFPLPDGRRCLECATCQPTPEEMGDSQADDSEIEPNYAEDFGV